MSGLSSVLLAAAVMAVSGLLCLVAPRPARDRVWAFLLVGAGIIGAFGAGAALLGGTVTSYDREWLLPVGRLALRLDPISALFLLPVFVVPPLAAVFGTAYWAEREKGSAAPGLRFFFGLLPAAMAGVLVAENGVAFLVAWEVMAVSAFFAILANEEEGEVRAASWVYLAATHLGTLCLIAFFTLLAAVAGSADLRPLAAGVASPGEIRALFVLGLVGFGLKAGLMPLHVWLPGAHASAPSHVSAVLSAVMLKLGVYGLVRLVGILPPGPPAHAWILIGLGAASAVLGILFALGQRDFKRLLAYSSVENVGIIVIGIGLAALGRSAGRPALATLGLAGAFLHVWNHAVFKSLLFLVSGVLLHATGTRRLDALGGLAARMPRTTVAAVIACVSIAALPPWNGFASEWILYRGVLADFGGDPWTGGVPVALAAVAIAFTGGLALLVVARFLGTGFLGAARSERVAAAHDPSTAMQVPLGILAALCLVLGVSAPFALVPVGRAVATWAGPAAYAPEILADAAHGLRFAAALGLAGLAGGFVLLAALRSRRTDGARPGTWDCGYLRPTARMQYGESSLSQTIVGLFRAALLPRGPRPSVEGPFPAPTCLATEVPDVVLDRGLLPALTWSARGVVRVRQLQPGRVQVHMLYILIGLLLLLVFA